MIMPSIIENQSSVAQELYGEVNNAYWSTLSGVRDLITSDLYRFSGSRGLKAFIKCFLIEKGFNFSFYYRIAHFLYCRRGSKFSASWFLSQIYNIFYRNIQVKYNVDISPKCAMGPGIAFNHLYGTVIYPGAILGKNINIGHFVTIGMKDSGKYQGAPTICDNVYIAPGAKVIGKIRIGNNATIGANAVVTKDVPDNTVVAGVPAKIIAYSTHLEHLRNLI